MIKKTVVEGRPLTQVFTSPLSFLHDFFGTSPIEPKPIRHGTPEYRKYREAIKSKKETWGAVSTGIEKQQNADERFKLRNNRGRM